MLPGLSEEFIRDNQNNLYWSWISVKQTLSEAFIEEFAHRVYWPEIAQYQKLSLDFILKHKLNIRLELLNKNVNIGDEVKQYLQLLGE